MGSTARIPTAKMKPDRFTNKLYTKTNRYYKRTNHNGGTNFVNDSFKN